MGAVKVAWHKVDGGECTARLHKALCRCGAPPMYHYVMADANDDAWSCELCFAMLLLAEEG